MVLQENISASGPKLSKIILGLWRLKDLPVKDLDILTQTAIEKGITTFDQADIYGNYQSQKYFGKIIKQKASLREKIQLVSKAGIHLPGSVFSQSGIGFYNTTKNHIINSVNNSLTDLNTDYLDVLLIHRPDLLMDPSVLDETFIELKKTGKVLHFGVSNFTNSQMDMLSARLETPLVTNQVEFSVLHYDPLYNGILDNCIKNNYAPMIWSPLAGGRLFNEKSEQVKRVTDTLKQISLEIGASSIDQVALAWIQKHPSNPFTIIGTLKPERIISTSQAQNINLSNEQWYRILIAAQNKPMP